RIKLDGLVISGSIDRIDETEDEVVLIDYKTSELEDWERADQLARESLQLLVYALAYRELTGETPNRLELRYVLSGEVGAAVPTKGGLENTRVRIQGIAESIRAGDFTAKPSQRNCSICACRPICRESAV